MNPQGQLAYALLFICSVFFASFRARQILRAYKVSHQNILRTLVLNFAAAWIGARILGELGMYSKIPSSLNEFAQGPVAFLGAGLALMLSSWLSCRALKISWTELMGELSPTLAIAHGLGRLGCFARGCCYGIFCEWPRHHQVPVQAFEALGLVIIAVLLRKSPRQRRWGFYLIFYSVLRFGLEFLRADPERGLWQIWGLELSSSQWISILLFAFGIGLDFRGRKLDNRGT